MIDFQPVSLACREPYTQMLLPEPERGCEYAFANLYLWGRQHIAFLEGCVAFFSHFYGRSVYPFPIGGGDKAAVIRAIIRDARQRGLPCRITGITEGDKAFLEENFPGVFHFRADRDSYDYVYDIHSLADLAGRRYQKKRNHANRFYAQNPGWFTRPLTPEELPQAERLVQAWYEARQKADPEGNYLLEKRAMARAFRHYAELGLEGLALYGEQGMVAVTMASRLRTDTFDIHFEKALEDADGAYAAINREFARCLRQKYPEAAFLDREDDMGLEGLRRAKLSYEPHHLIAKHCAYLKEELYAP